MMLTLRRGGRHLISPGSLSFWGGMCSHGDIAGNSYLRHSNLLRIVTGDGLHALGPVTGNQTPMWGR